MNSHDEQDPVITTIAPVSLDENIQSSVKLSKNQQKRLLREERRKESKPEWRKLQKAKRKLKDQIKRDEYAAKGLEYPVKKRVRTDPSKLKAGKIIFDLSFEGMMVNREMSSLCSQIMRCYSSNRRSENPFNLEISSFSGPICDKFISMYPEHQKWDISFNPDHFFKTHDDIEKIVYLTPDSENVLDSINPDYSYIIGGIVDKNRFKGKTYEIAKNMNIKTARLPVSEHLDLKSSSVLTIFHVVEILLKYKECRDWKVSLEAFVPKRNVKLQESENQNQPDPNDINSSDSEDNILEKN